MLEFTLFHYLHQTLARYSVFLARYSERKNIIIVLFSLHTTVWNETQMAKVQSRFQDKLPERISRLEEIAFDIWWSWNAEAKALFRALDLPLYHQTNHNPVAMLERIPIDRLLTVAQDPSFLLKYDQVLHLYDLAWKKNNLWFPKVYPEHKDKLIAYLSCEFAVHHSLPIYSGGLGVLSGDHCKSASDLGLNFIAVGFMYYQGYFTQSISPEGWQIANYETTDFTKTALQHVYDKDGDELIISIRLGDRDVKIKIWYIKLGRTDLYLLDTDLDENIPEDRALSHRLYGGDRDLRIRQEIVFGLGSIKLFEVLDKHPTIWHLNEGHVAFAALELVRRKMVEGYSFDEAKKEIEKVVGFTTHTPVPAGHEEFEISLIEKYLAWMMDDLQLSKKEFVNLGTYPKGTGKFNMTMLAINLSSVINGVSQLNAKTMNTNLKSLWSQKYDYEPIIGITNGVHVPTWLATEMQELYQKYIDPHWMEQQENALIWEKVYDIPDRQLWHTHCFLKNKMLTYIRDRARHKWRKGKINSSQAISSGLMLDPNALTIGFARRFAPYKRANLIFRDVERLKRIVNNPYFPVQLIFAGKSHPDNEAGCKLIQEIYQHTLNPDFSGRVVFLEDYGMNVAQFLIQGVDVWMNNPRRPLEASGTSGMKAAMNGIPNFSVLDGWWAEGYNGHNGWVIGSPTVVFEDQNKMDEFDANSLYNVLESEIRALYYQQDNAGIPRNWLDVVRESIKSSIHTFSTRRMVQEYTMRFYNELYENK